MYTPRDRENIEKGVKDCVDYLMDMVADGDWCAFHTFINQVNGAKARRGLPHREPVAVLDTSDLRPQDI